MRGWHRKRIFPFPFHFFQHLQPLDATEIDDKLNTTLQYLDHNSTNLGHFVMRVEIYADFLFDMVKKICFSLEKGSLSISLKDNLQWGLRVCTLCSSFSSSSQGRHWAKHIQRRFSLLPRKEKIMQMPAGSGIFFWCPHVNHMFSWCPQ